MSQHLVRTNSINSSSILRPCVCCFRSIDPSTTPKIRAALRKDDRKSFMFERDDMGDDDDGMKKSEYQV